MGLLLLLCAWGNAAARPDAVPGLQPKDLWHSADFQRRFDESFLSETDIEPKVTQSERDVMLKVLKLMSTDKRAEAKTLLEKNTNAAASAVFDFTLAQLNWEQGEPNLAIANYESAVEKHKKFRRAWNNLGLLYAEQQQFGKAAKALTKTIETGGGSALTYGMLGFAYLSLQDYLAAESAFRMAVVLDPESLDWKMKLVYTQYRQERYSEVAALTERLIADSPADPNLWMLQANAYIGLNQPLKAAVNYEMVDSLGASSADSLNMLADIYVNQELFDIAVETYGRALALKGGKPDRALRAAKVLAARGATSQARTLTAEIEMQHGDALDESGRKDLLRLRARIAAADGADGEEIKVLEEIVAMDPLDGEALILLGRHCARSGETEKAVFYYERAESLESHEADAKVRHAQLMVSQGQYTEAIALLKRAQTLKPREDVQRYLEQVERVAKSR